MQAVIELNDTNFYDYIPHTNETNKTLEQPVMLKFWASWCGHCKKLAPKYENISNKEENKNIQFYAIECTNPLQKPLCAEQGIDGFPTIYLYDTNGIRHVYHGYMEEINIQLFIDSFSQPLFRENQTDEQLMNLAKQYEFDHFYKLQVTNCSDYEQLFETTRGSSIISCEQGFENNTMYVIKNNGNIFNQTILYDDQHNGTQEMLQFYFFHEEPMYQQLTPYNFEEIIKCGGIITIYGNNTELEEENKFLKEQSERLDVVYHYGYLLNNDAGRSLLEDQLKLNGDKNYLLIFYLGDDRRLKVSVKEYNKGTDNFTEIYNEIYADKEKYTIQIPEQEEEKEEAKKPQIKSLTLSQKIKKIGFLKIYITTTIILCSIFILIIKCCKDNQDSNEPEQKNQIKQDQVIQQQGEQGEQLIDEQITKN